MRHLLAVMFVWSTGFVGTEARAQYFDLYDLGTGPGTSGEGLGINNQGEVIGSSFTRFTGPTRATKFYGPGSYSDLSVTASGTFDLGYARAINNFGTTVGLTRDGYRGFSRTSAGARILDPIYNNSTTDAWNVNARGWVVGNIMTGSGQRAFLVDDAGMRDIGELPLTQGCNRGTNTFGINDPASAAPRMTGTSNCRPFIYYTDSRVLEALPTSLANAPTCMSSRLIARDINDHDTVAGWLECGRKGGPITNHLVIWSRGKGGAMNGRVVNADGSSGDQVWAINNSGWVVLDSQVGGAPKIYRPNRGIEDLNSLLLYNNVGPLWSARDVNDSGWIAGAANAHAVVVVPR